MKLGEALRLLMAFLTLVVTAASQIRNRESVPPRERLGVTLWGVASGVLSMAFAGLLAADIAGRIRPPLWVELFVFAGLFGLTLYTARRTRLASRRLSNDAHRAAQLAAAKEILFNLAPDGTPGTPSSLDPYALGVTRSQYAGTGRDPYIPRTSVDRRLDRALRRHGRDPAALTVVIGLANAGKSRTAWEALRRGFPNARVLVPRPDGLQRLRDLDLDVVCGAGAQMFVWLNDLDQYLLGRHPLTVRLMDELLDAHPHLIFIASITAQRFYGLFEAPDPEAFSEMRGPMPLDSSGSDPNALPSNETQIFAGANLIRLDRTLEQPELAVAQELYPGERFDRGPGEQLVAAAAHDRLNVVCRDADPVVWAVIQAAVDWRRCGISQPIPRGALRDLARCYAVDAVAGDPDSTALDDAIDRAHSVPRDAPVKALERKAGREVEGSVCFDYLLELADGRNRSPIRAIPSRCALTIVELAPVEDLRAVARAARVRRLNPRVQETAGLRLMDSGQSDLVLRGKIVMATWHIERGEFESARPYLDEVASCGDVELEGLAMNNAGWMATLQDDEQLALALFATAAEKGNVRAMTNLGWRAARDGNVSEARRWYLRAAESRDPSAMTAYGAFEVRCDDIEAGEPWLRRAAAMGDAAAMVHLGDLDRRRRRWNESRDWHQRAADRGLAWAMAEMGRCAVERRDYDDAEEWFRQAEEAGFEGLRWYRMTCEQAQGSGDAKPIILEAAEAGETWAMLDLAAEAIEEGNFDEAEAWHTRIVDAGDPRGFLSRASAALKVGDSVAAEESVARATDAAVKRALVVDAMLGLGRSAEYALDREAASFWYEKAAALGNSDAMVELATLAFLRGEESEDERWSLRAAELENADGMHRLGYVAVRRGDQSNAQEWFRRAAALGHTGSMIALADTSKRSGDLKTAEQWYREAYDAGDSWAAHKLAMTLDDLGRFEQAVEWYGRSGMPEEVALYELAHPFPPPRGLRKWVRRYRMALWVRRRARDHNSLYERKG